MKLILTTLLLLQYFIGICQDPKIEIDNWKNIILNKEFSISSNLKEIDSSLILSLETKLDEELAMANPKEDWDASCGTFKGDLPRKQLIWFAEYETYHIVTYRIGGSNWKIVCHLIDLSSEDSNYYSNSLNSVYGKYLKSLKFRKFKKDVKNGIIDLKDFYQN